MSLIEKWKVPLIVRVYSIDSVDAEVVGLIICPVNFDIWNIFGTQDLDPGRLISVKLKVQNDFALVDALFDWTDEKEQAVGHHVCND